MAQWLKQIPEYDTTRIHGDLSSTALFGETGNEASDLTKELYEMALASQIVLYCTTAGGK